MAKFIQVGNSDNEHILNLDSIREIRSYHADYASEKDDIKGVQIIFIGSDEPILYQDLDYENLKKLVFDK